MLLFAPPTSEDILPTKPIVLLLFPSTPTYTHRSHTVSVSPGALVPLRDLVEAEALDVGAVQ